jgi:hypothetical protein
MDVEKMKRCPVCQSRKFHGSKAVGWKCRNCGFENIPDKVLATMQKANNDGGIIEVVKPSYTINKSSLDWQNSTRDLAMNDLAISPLFQEIHDHHSNAWKFKIIKDNPNLDLERQKGFKGKYFVIPHELKIRKSKEWLVIYNEGRNKVPLKNLDKTEVHILQGLKNIALEISQKYNFEIESIPIPLASNRPEVKTGFLSANNFYEEEAKAVYPTPSPIELQGKNAVKNAINLSAMLEDFRIVMEREIQNKQLHQSVLIDMKDTLKAIQINVSRPEGLASKILRIFNSFRSAVVKHKTDSTNQGGKINVE